MITKRIIPCLDVKDGRVVKGVNFLGLADVSSPVKLAEYYSKCGAGEVVLNSSDTDGMKGGFDLEMLAAVCDAVSVPVIASGGAGCIDDFVRLFKALPRVDAGLAASIFHFGEVEIHDLKRVLRDNDIIVRL